MRSVTLFLIAGTLMASENNVLEIPTLAGKQDAFSLQVEENFIEEDTARTFALTSAYEFGKHRFLLNYDMITMQTNLVWKDTSTDPVIIEAQRLLGITKQVWQWNRIDRLDGIYTYKLGEDTSYVRVGGGFRYYGNIGGGKLQYNTHKFVDSSSVNTVDNTLFSDYEDLHKLLAVGQVCAAGVSGSDFGGFYNVNMDVSSELEVNANGFAGAQFYKTVFIGAYTNQEFNSVSKTVRLCNNYTSISENTYGIRLSVSVQHMFADFSIGHGMNHLRVGFTF